MSLENCLSIKKWKRPAESGRNCRPAQTASMRCSESGRQSRACWWRPELTDLLPLLFRSLLGFQGSLQRLPSHTDPAANPAHFDFTVTLGERGGQRSSLAR